VIVAVGVFVAVLVGGKGAFASTLGCTHPKRTIVAVIPIKIIVFRFILLPFYGYAFCWSLGKKIVAENTFQDLRH